MFSEPAGVTPGIGGLREQTLHAQLKQWYSRPGDRIEVGVEGYLVDIGRQGLLIEVQTNSFAHIRAKLNHLLESHSLRLVHPIAQVKWVVRLPEEPGQAPRRRRSPKHGSPLHLFNELVSFPHLALHPRFSLEVLLTHEEELRRHDGRGSWRRRGWSIWDRQLLAVVDSCLLCCPADYLALLPGELPSPFTAAELAEASGQPLRLAHRAVYCLRHMGLARPVGKRGRAREYAIRDGS